jgi:hypothetical protein
VVVSVCDRIINMRRQSLRLLCGIVLEGLHVLLSLFVRIYGQLLPWIERDKDTGSNVGVNVVGGVSLLE